MTKLIVLCLLLASACFAKPAKPAAKPAKHHHHHFLTHGAKHAAHGVSRGFKTVF